MDTSLPEIRLASNEIALPPVVSKPTVQVLGGSITALDLDGTVDLLLDMVRERIRRYVCIANVHTATLAARDEHFRKALDGAACVVADGMPVVWRVRAAGYPEAGRVHGADLVETMCAAGVSEGLRHGFFGGLDGIAETMVVRLKQRFPAMQVAGVWSPGVIQTGESSPLHLLETISGSECDILWVGLGAPKQELWMAQHRSCLTMPVMIGVGQAFDILAGRTVRAPAWMGAHGLEWLYRLVHEPRRLWKRYVIYNSLFLWYLLLERFGNSAHRARP